MSDLGRDFSLVVRRGLLCVLAAGLLTLAGGFGQPLGDQVTPPVMVDSLAMTELGYQPPEGSEFGYQPPEGSEFGYQPPEGSEFGYQPPEDSEFARVC